MVLSGGHVFYNYRQQRYYKTAYDQSDGVFDYKLF